MKEQLLFPWSMWPFFKAPGRCQVAGQMTLYLEWGKSSLEVSSGSRGWNQCECQSSGDEKFVLVDIASWRAKQAPALRTAANWGLNSQSASSRSDRRSLATALACSIAPGFWFRVSYWPRNSRVKSQLYTAFTASALYVTRCLIPASLLLRPGRSNTQGIARSHLAWCSLTPIVTSLSSHLVEKNNYLLNHILVNQVIQSS